MKKKSQPKKDCECGCQELGKIVDQISNKVKTNVNKAKKYAKNNPKETKAVAAGIGAFLLAVVALFVGKKRKNKNKDIDLDI
jgi:ElaB/YqjD/DUF883 family membrane-anchored ribosome-binding protein